MRSVFRRRGWIAIGASAAAAIAVVVTLLLVPREPERLGAPLDLEADGFALRSATVYYLAEDSLSLVPAERHVLGHDTLREQVEDLVDLLASPAAGLRAPLPAGVRLLHVYWSEQTLVLDFTLALEGMAGMSILEDRLRLSALVRTLAQNVGNADRIRLLVHGRPLTRWGEHLVLDPVIRTEDWK